MSNVNIKRAVENIRSGTTVYTPIVETIVNAIHAIENKKEKKGEVTVVVARSRQLELDGGVPDVESFEIRDNGIGFTDENRDSFDTLYSDQKIAEGGKGFGRFTCLKYFEDLDVASTYQDGDTFKNRAFRMGKQNDIIVDEVISPSDSNISGSTVRLSSVKSTFPDRRLKTIATNIVEKLLPFFITADYVCPRIVIMEVDGADSITLNDYFNNELSGTIGEIEISEKSFSLKGNDAEHDFAARVFKFYSPKAQKSKISLVAHKREVTDTAIYHYIPEFVDEFYEKTIDGNNDRDRNFIIKVYVFGEYLDSNVSLERGGFEFKKDRDLLLGISQSDIERKASDVAKKAVGEEIIARQKKKEDRVTSYVEEQAPWHREMIPHIDLSNMSFNPSNEEIESALQAEKFKQETSIKREVSQLLAESSVDKLKADAAKIVTKISDTSRNDLVHYVALRKNVLDIFEKSLQLDPDGNYSSEGVVHDIIFPRKEDSETISFEDHNLWIVDERLNFARYISSDLPLNGSNSERPDLAVYNRRVVFRGDNEPSNPVTIFEFKKPQRDDFANPSSKEDPIQQIVRYVNSIKEGDFRTPEGRAIRVGENTPFYGYVVCDITKKVEKWLKTEKDFRPMPDGLGWFQWRYLINLYIEVLSWDKVLRDANMRNKIFFHKLGLQ